MSLRGIILLDQCDALNLGYLLTHRGDLSPHVKRRISKVAEWDILAVNMPGNTGGPPVSVVAEVREATAGANIFHRAKFTSGTRTKFLDAATAKQTEIAKETLGLRPSTENAGVLTESGWTDIETKAAKARLLFWRRLGRTDSFLMQILLMHFWQ